jgi:hypothetical protein
LNAEEAREAGRQQQQLGCGTAGGNIFPRCNNIPASQPYLLLLPQVAQLLYGWRQLCLALLDGCCHILGSLTSVNLLQQQQQQQQQGASRAQA